jgi:SAM-dependent methyltransferase
MACRGERITLAFSVEPNGSFAPGYQANINDKWIPALDGVQQKLTSGTRVADIGCGHGSSTLIMAKAFPNSEFEGFDLHPASIDAANQHAQVQQIPNVHFSIAVENLNPVGRAYYGFSTMICTPGSLSQEVGLALGAQAGERRLGEVVSKAGFTRFRRAAETPFNLILEARP